MRGDHQPSGRRAWGATSALLFCLPLAAGSAAFAQGEPGTLSVDPEAAERALERTLVESGVLLLPRGAFEIEPSLRYERSETEGSVLGRIDGDLVLDRQTTERNELTVAFDLRYGLPGDAQVELSFPIVYADQSIDEGVFASGEDADERGLGDISIGVAKTLLKDASGLPDVVGRVTWDTDLGEDSSGPVDITSDFNEIQGTVSALWRLDPVALSAGVAYEYTFEKDDFQPGDVFGVALGTSLAASPTVALGMNFNVSYRAESTLDGDSIEDSSQNQATISFSISSVVRRNALLSLEFGAGLTEDSPDYFAAVSVPVRW